MAQLFDVLTIWQMYVVALAASVLTVFFDVAYQSYLPVLVSRDQPCRGQLQDRRLVGGCAVRRPRLAGALVAAVGAPYAVVVDAASFLVSGVTTAAVRDNEQPPPARAAGMRLRDEIREGLSFVVRHPTSRPGSWAVRSELLSSMAGAVEIVFLVRTLHAAPAVVGGVYSVAALGALLGAATASPLARRLGSARIVWLSLAVTEPLLFSPWSPSAAGGCCSLAAAASFSPRSGLGRLQRGAGVLPAGHLPPRTAGPHERVGAVHRLGHDAAGRSGRWCARHADRRADHPCCGGRRWVRVRSLRSSRRCSGSGLPDRGVRRSEALLREKVEPPTSETGCAPPIGS